MQQAIHIFQREGFSTGLFLLHKIVLPASNLLDLISDKAKSLGRKLAVILLASVLFVPILVFAGVFFLVWHLWLKNTLRAATNDLQAFNNQFESLLSKAESGMQGPSMADFNIFSKEFYKAMTEMTAFWNRNADVIREGFLDESREASKGQMGFFLKKLTAFLEENKRLLALSTRYFAMLEQEMSGKFFRTVPLNELDAQRAAVYDYLA